MEKVLEDSGCEADKFKGQKIVVEEKLGSEKLGGSASDEGLEKYS